LYELLKIIQWSALCQSCWKQVEDAQSK